MAVESIQSFRQATSEYFQRRREALDKEQAECESRAHLEAIRRLAGSACRSAEEEIDVLRGIIQIAETRVAELC